MERLKINQKFASSYNKKKEREELSQLREKYGDVDTSSSSSEEEDEDAEGLTTDVQRDFLRTLSLLKSKDPSIYDSQSQFYSEAGESSVAKATTKSSKPVHLKDYERQRLMTKGSLADVSEEEEEEEEGGWAAGTARGLSYSEEQEDLKASFKKAAELEEGALLVPRHKTQEEKAREESEYVQWLKGGGVELADKMAMDLEPLKQYWSDPSLSADERFLRDYILNKGYLDTSMDQVPRYEDVVASDSEGPPSDSEDEEALEEQEIFERRYNFRFEEPDGDLITSYPRTLGGLVRREDESRKMKRKERVEKKAKEKEKRKEEIRRLRNLQEIEMKEKLERLARVTGNPVESFGLEDLEADFDPDSYDSVMGRVFDAGYYEGGEGEEDKPEFSDFELEEEMEADDWSSQPYLEVEGFNMDAEQDLEGQSHADKRRPKRKRKRVHLDPAAQLEEKEELESRLKGELFRYRQVEPNDFGLTTEEILCSDVKELNHWVSLNKAVQYLTPEEEERERRQFRKKARNWKKKKSILTTFYSASANDEETGTVAEERVAEDDEHVTSTSAATTPDQVSKKVAPDQVSKKKVAPDQVSKKKSLKSKLKGKKVSEARLKSYGL